MRLNKFTYLLPLTIALLPCFVYAQTSSSCENAWMTNVSSTTDEVTFRDFGQKYCECIAKQPLGTNAGSEKTQNSCMTRTALYLTMDYIGSEEGLSNLTEDKIKSSCNTIWDIATPNNDVAGKQKNSKICACAAPKLNALAKEKENYTDREWYEKIDDITAGC